MQKLVLGNYDAVAFDLEGTLADTIPVHHAARLAAFKQHGYGHITAAQHALGPTYGSYATDIIGGILYAAGEIDEAVPFAENDIVRAIIATKTKLYDQAAAKGFDPMPGAIDFLHRIVPLFGGHAGLVTSSEEKYFWPFADKYGLRDMFPTSYVVSHDTVVAEGLRGKPHPDPYTLVAKRLGAHELLVFEDTVPGAASAVQAGATVVALGFDPQTALLLHKGGLPHPPDVVVRDYDEASRVLGLG